MCPHHNCHCQYWPIQADISVQHRLLLSAPITSSRLIISLPRYYDVFYTLLFPWYQWLESNILSPEGESNTAPWLPDVSGGKCLVIMRLPWSINTCDSAKQETSHLSSFKTKCCHVSVFIHAGILFHFRHFAVIGLESIFNLLIGLSRNVDLRFEFYKGGGGRRI